MPLSIPITSLLLSSAVMLVGCSSPTPPGQAALSVRAVDAAVASDPTGGQGPEAARATAAVAGASVAEVAAFMAADPAVLAALWSDSFVVTNPFNQFATKAQVLSLVANGILAFSSYDRTIEYARAYGDQVIVAGSETVVWAGHMPLTGHTSHLRYTAVWARHGNEWQEVARHASLVLAGAPGGPPVP